MRDLSYLDVAVLTPGGADMDAEDAAAEATAATEPRPLFRTVEPALPFPIHALGPLRHAVEAIHLITQAPIALCAQSALAATTLAVQAHRDVELPGAGKRPLVGIFATIAASGERKTSTDRIALAEVNLVEKEWREEHAGKLSSFANDHAAWKAAREHALKDGKGDKAKIGKSLDEIGLEPRKPPDPMLLVADPTPEALVLHLRDSRPSCGVFTSEGGILVGGPAFNDESRMRTGALFNTLWDGDPIRRSRVGTGTAFLPGRRVSVHVMMQPSVADRLLGDPMLEDMGLLARVLTVDPASTIGTRLFKEEPPECRITLASYNAKLRALLLKPPATRLDAPDVLDPPAMRLNADAKRSWIEFYNAVETDLADGGALHSVRAFGAKMAEHAGRLAATLALFADPDAMDVTGKHMACGIDLAKHYAAEALRLKRAAMVAPELRLAARLLAWWQSLADPEVYLALIYQRGPNPISDATTARRLVGILEDHGWVQRLPPGTVIDEAPRREAWTLWKKPAQ